MNAYTAISGGGFQVPSPTYDLNGNTLTLPRNNGSTLGLTWDSTDRLRSVSSPISNPTSTISSVYDPLGRLVWIRTTTQGGTGGSPVKDEVWSWSGWTLLARELFTGTTIDETYRYTWGPDLSGTLEGAGGVGGLLAIERAVGNSTTWDIRHVHYDANGNVLCLTDTNGTASARYRYSPFGETISTQDLDNSGWATKNIHRFSTKPEVAGTSLLYYGYRHYDPQTGRWLSKDPIEELGGVNLYGFVGNNSVGQWDILGNVGISVDCPGATSTTVDVGGLMVTYICCCGNLSIMTISVSGGGSNNNDVIIPANLNITLLNNTDPNGQNAIVLNPRVGFDIIGPFNPTIGAMLFNPDGTLAGSDLQGLGPLNDIAEGRLDDAINDFAGLFKGLFDFMTNQGSTICGN